MPNPGVQSQFIAKSGGNQFNGEYYIGVQQLAAGREHPGRIPGAQRVQQQPIRAHSNEIDRYWDTAINIGGPIKRDKVWWFGTYRKQFNAIGQPNFQFDKTFDTTLWNAIGKGTYQATQNHKFVAITSGARRFSPIACPVAPAVRRTTM